MGSLKQHREKTMNIRSVLAAVAFSSLAVVASSLPSFAQSNPLIGTWKLNLEKSKFVSGTAPKEQINTYRPGRTKHQEHGQECGLSRELP